MIEQTVIPAVLISIETHHRTKNKFVAWTKAIENAAQISGQNNNMNSIL